MWIAAAFIIALPVLYGVIFMSSFMDPYGNLSRLPVGIVNLDKGATVHGRPYGLGADLLSRLNQEKPLTLVSYTDEESVRRAVRTGDVYFSVVIPPDFSQAALAARSDKPGLLHLYVSRGGSYFATKSAESLVGKMAAGLSTTLDQLRWSLVTQAEPRLVSGDPAGLSQSVQVSEESTAFVPTNGAAFAPYFMALSLWIGAMVISFVFPLRKLAESCRRSGQIARIAGKLAFPALVMVLQAVAIVTGTLLIGIQFQNVASVLLTCVVAGIVFLLIFLALTLLLGDAGRLVGILLMVTQLAASGGAYPIQLSPPFFQAVNKVLPFTYCVDALRSGLAGAYEGRYPGFMLVLGIAGAIAVALAIIGRRQWRFVADVDYQSAVGA